MVVSHTRPALCETTYHELMSEGLEPMFVRINPAPAALPGRSNCVQVHDRAIDALTALATRLGIPVVE